MLSQLPKKFKFRIGIVVLIVLIVLFAGNPAQAIGEELASSVFLLSLQTFILQAFAWVAQVFELVIRYSIDPNLAVIRETWSIVRDFCNMFFILIIVIMAFATIFDIGGYQANSQLIVKFLIVAVLINFSLTISGLFIRGVDVINGTFISGLGASSARLARIFDPVEILGDQKSLAQSIGSVMGKAGCYVTALSVGAIGNPLLNCSKVGDTLGALSTGKLSWSYSFRLMGTIVLTLIAGSGLLVATVFALIRIPFLWFLMIFSPLAGLASILPATREGWNRWLKEFLGWNLFLPVYLFALYFGMYFLSRQNDILSGFGLAPQVTSSPLVGLGLSLQMVFFYIVAGVVLWGGTAFALAVSRAGGGMASEWGLKGGLWVRDNIPFISPAARGAKEAVVDRFGRIRQEGLPVGFGTKLGGVQAGARQQAWVAEQLGMRGAQQEAYKKQVDYFAEVYKKQNRSPDELRNIVETGKIFEKLGALRRLKDEKNLSPEELKTGYHEFMKNVGVAAAEGFVAGIDFKKDFDKNERSEWFRDPNLGVEVRKKVARVMAEEGELNVKWVGDEEETNDLLTAVRLNLARDKRNLRPEDVTLDSREEKAVREFLLKASDKKIIESYRLLNKFKIKNPKSEGGEKIFDLGDDLEMAIVKKEVPDMVKLLTNFYDAKNNVIKADLNPDQSQLLETLKKVLGKRADKENFLRTMYNYRQITPEQEGAVSKFAEILQVRLQKESQAQNKPKDSSSGGEPPPTGDSTAGGARAEVHPGNIIDLRNL